MLFKLMSLSFTNTKLHINDCKNIKLLVRYILKNRETFRYLSSGHETPRTSVLKTYDEIVAEVKCRQSQMFSRRLPKIPSPDLEHCTAREASSYPIAPGDLVLSGSTVYLILRAPETCYDEYLATDISGKIHEISLRSIKFRLSSFAPSQSLYLLASELLKKFTHPENSDQNVIRSYSNSVVGQSIDPVLYKAFCNKLRKCHVEIENRAKSLLREVILKVDELQKADLQNCLLFTDFVAKVFGKPSEEVRVLDLCAVNQCLNHDSLLFKVKRNISCLDLDQITIISKTKEFHMIMAQYSSNFDISYLRDYACGNLPPGVPVSSAIALLRSQFPALKEVDPHICAEVLKIRDCAMWDKLDYQWLCTEAASRGSKISIDRNTDKMLKFRENFDLPVFSIDSAGTKCVEDGLSLKEISENVVQLGVHTADPAAFMDINNELTPLVSGFYNNNRAYRMLPSELEGFLSLRNGPRPSLSLFVDFDLATGALSNIQLKSLTLTNIQNFEFDDIDVSKPHFYTLLRVAQLLKAQRIKNGSFTLTSQLIEEGVVKDDPDSSGSMIVAEMMIMANNLVANFCYDNKIPIFYRNQRLVLPSTQIRKAFYYEHQNQTGTLSPKWRRLISSPSLSLKPKKFASLGVNKTTRFTSPLRLWDNLIVNAQLNAHLSGARLPFASQDLSNMEGYLQLMDSVVRRLTKEYYFGKRMEQLKVGTVVEGIVLDPEIEETSKCAVVFLPDLKLHAFYVGNTKLSLESTHHFVVSKVMRYGKKVEVKLVD